jgi:benzylsuccinate CoA-transferase BbsF subunit
MGDPEWAQQEWAMSEETRLLHAGEINVRLEEFLSTMTREEVVKGGQAAGVTVAPYHSIDEVVDSEQIIERRYLSDVSHPVVGTHRYPTGPWRFSGVGPRPGPAPRLGQDNEEVFGPSSDPDTERARPERFSAAPASRRSAEAVGVGALNGIRVLDFTWAVAGPLATMILASLGAEVIKVETSLRLDVLRRSAFTGSTTNRQKKAITLNLRHEKAVDLAKRLVAQSDVVAESFRPGVMDGLGLGYPDLKAVKDDIIMHSSSMAGQRGPYSRFAGYAPMFVALSGLGDMTGYEDGPPTQIRVGGDIIVGVHGGFALLAALAHHQATGQGTHIDLSAIEAQSSLIGDSILDYTATGRVPTRAGNDEPGLAPHNCYRCAGEDNWVSIAVESNDEWEGMVAAMGFPSWAKDPRFDASPSRWRLRRELDDLVGQWTAERSAVDITQVLQASGVAAMPSFRATDLFADPHVVVRDLVATVPGAGTQWPLIRLGGRLSATPLVLDQAGPPMGQDNDHVFQELLGLSRADIASLEEEGVFT